MRIIDKNYDYYDYLQDPSDNLVFDRRDSFVLTRELVCDKMRLAGWYDDEPFRIGLLQCGATYWLLLFTITQHTKENYGFYPKPLSYDIEVLATWKNYTRPRAVISFDIIYFDKTWQYGFSRNTTVEQFKKMAATMQQAVINKEYEAVKSLGTNIKVTSIKGRFTEEKQTLPILSACGISNVISPEDMYNALDEHFALVKSDAESTVAEGTTNQDKIVNHGFDVKASFRGNT